MEFKHEGPLKLRIGVVVAKGVNPDEPILELEEGIQKRISDLEHGLSVEEDAFRVEVRSVFRNGTYKPSGRAKPASEYLLSAASDGRFPRINSLVDCCNHLSLSSLLPISIWDANAAGSERFLFRLGLSQESYVFNSSGQSIDLQDLIVGCSIDSDGVSHPIVNAVKDSMSTKTNATTSDVVAAIYSPMTDGPVMSLEDVCQSFVRILSQSASGAEAEYRILLPGEEVRI